MSDGISTRLKRFNMRLVLATQLCLKVSDFSFNSKSIANIASLAENVLRPQGCIREDYLLCNVCIICQAHQKVKATVKIASRSYQCSP